MKRICAWCKKEIGSEKEAGPDELITHGICSLCVLKLTVDSPRTVRDILNFIKEPIFLIDAEGVVKDANNSASKMLGKEYSDIEDHLGGDAFECSYSKHDGGCGKTVHCKTCTIRNIVMDTLASGHGYMNVACVSKYKYAGGNPYYEIPHLNRKGW